MSDDIGHAKRALRAELRTLREKIEKKEGQEQ
jgi:uncharacterized protein (DUF2267 family)